MKLFSLFLLILTSLHGFAQLAIETPAAFERKEGLVMVWAYEPHHDSLVANIIQSIDTSGHSWLIYNPQQSQTDTNEIRQFLMNIGVEQSSFSFLSGATNDINIGSYGPWTNYGIYNDQPHRYILDAAYDSLKPLDDAIPQLMADQWNWNLASTELILDGSHFQFDGLMRGFASDYILEQNPGLTEYEIKTQHIQLFNVNDFVFLNQLKHSGGGQAVGINQFMKLIDYESIAVASLPDSLPDYDLLEENVSLLSSLLNRFGDPYKIIRIPSPPNDDGQYPGHINGESRSYTTMVQINEKILLPSYNNAAFDQQAVSLLQETLTGYQIIPIHATSLSANHRSLQAIISEVAPPHFLRILHRKTEGPQEFQEDYGITCLCNAMEAVEAMWLYYKVDDAPDYTKTEVHLVCPQHVGIIEGLSPSDTVHYYLEAISENTYTSYPLSAPQGYFTFWFDIVHTFELNEIKDSYQIAPNPNDGNFTILSDQNISAISLSIWNTSGQLLHTLSYTSGQQLHLPESMENGTYLITLDDGVKTHQLKMILNK